MEYRAEMLKDKIDSYFSGIISKEILGKWAEQAYYDLITGGYIEMHKLETYPFLKIVSRFHIEMNDIADEYPSTEDDIKMIQEILSGERKFHFQVKLAIPFQLYKMFPDKVCFNEERQELFLRLYNEIVAFTNEKNRVTIMNLIKIISQLGYENDTLLDELEKVIIRICQGMIKTDLDREGIQNNLQLYVQGSKNSLSLTNKLMEYLECYLGKRNFYVLVSFEKGRRTAIMLI